MPDITGAQFLVALLAGLLLAYAFQLLLTYLSLATGASALKSVVRPDEGRAGRRKGDAGGGADSKGWEDSAVKIGSGVGTWALLTSSLALFAACWLATELIRLQDNSEAVILGLVIWSAFMLSAMWFEGVAAASLLGIVGSAAKSGFGTLSAPFKALADRFAGGGRRREAVQTAEEVAAAVRRELFGDGQKAEGPGLLEKVADYARSQAKPLAFEASRFGRQVKALLSEPELVEMAKRGELQSIDRARFAEIVAGRTDLDKQQAERMVDALHNAWNRFLGNASPRPGDGPPAGGESGGRGLAARYKDLKEYLRRTGREELNPERIEQEVKTLVLDPRLGLAQLKQHMKELDRESLVRVLAQRQDLSPEEANRIADQIDLARSRALSAKEQAEHRAREIRDRVLSRVMDLVYAAEGPEVDYEGVRADFEKLLDDPKAGFAALTERLQGLDRESLIAALSSRPGIHREEAEKIADRGEAVLEKGRETVDKARAGVEKVAERVLAAKQAVLDRARKVEEEAHRRMEEAKRVSREQAEAARKVAAAAAWWLVAIAVASGAAAALGALMAAAT